jgi:hypothetical protein
LSLRSKNQSRPAVVADWLGLQFVELRSAV